MTPPPFVLRGRVASSCGTSADARYVWVDRGRIVSSTREKPVTPPDALHVEFGFDDCIVPGFIDLHSHADYNLLPIWEAPGAPYDHRFVWRSSPDYTRAVRGVMKALASSAEDPERHRRLLATFAEVQALAGGTTTLQESWSLDDAFAGAPQVLLRGTANARELDLPADQRVLSVIDFFEPDDDGRPRQKRRWDASDGLGETWIEHYQALRERGELAACIVHLAEGRSGVASANADAYSRAEMRAVIAHPAFADVDAVRDSRLSLVHGCGLDFEDPEMLGFLRDRDIAVIWSPVSNLLLYGDTLDPARLMEEGITVALGSDWSPSGSKHVADEARFARFLIEAADLPISDAQVFEMITTVPARRLGQPSLGQLVPGSWADLIVLQSAVGGADVLESVFRSSDSNIRLVAVGGQPMYGDAPLLEMLGAPGQSLPEREGRAVRGKAVHLAPRAGDGAVSFADAIDELEDALKSLDAPLGPVQRSNLLSASDRPYSDRVVDLRSLALRWGDLVRKKRRGWAPGGGRA